MAFLSLHWTRQAAQREAALSPEELTSIGMAPIGPIPTHPEWTQCFSVQRTAKGDDYDGMLIGFIGSCGPAGVWGWDAGDFISPKCRVVKGQNARSRPEAVARLVNGIKRHAKEDVLGR